MEAQKEIIIKEFAQNELEQAFDYYAENYSLAFAEKFRIEFYETVKTVHPNPYIYPECRFLPTKTQMYRNIIWGNYLIVYKIKSKTIEILSLFHTKPKPSKVKRLRKG
jgi:plasmid stabilization system protein ParE